MCSNKKTDNQQMERIIECFENEKYTNKEYLFELQNFLDRLDNLENENLKKDLIYKMHKMDSIISKIAIDIINRETNKILMNIK